MKHIHICMSGDVFNVVGINVSLAVCS